MTLDTYAAPERLYIARGDEVNPNRPMFAGDVYSDIGIPGLENRTVMIVAHPCSFRAGSGIRPRVLVAGVRTIPKEGANAWTKGHYNLMPLPELIGATDFSAADFEEIGQAATADLLAASRLACLSEIGINMLQQRLTFHLTRVEVPTSLFNQQFAHTMEEADLLEEWVDTLTRAGWAKAIAESRFETFLRSGTPSLQDDLLEAQARTHVRISCRREAARIVVQESP